MPMRYPKDFRRAVCARGASGRRGLALCLLRVQVPRAIGSPDPAPQDMVVNKKLVLSIMRELGIKGLPGPKRRKKNLVKRGHRRGPGPAKFYGGPAQRLMADRHHRAPERAKARSTAVSSWQFVTSPRSNP